MNAIAVSHKDRAQMQRFIDVLNNREGLFNSFVPQPEVEGDDWYGWRLAHWGTKWDVATEASEYIEIDGDADDGITFTIETAWGPPINFYAAMKRQGFEIDATYYEPSMCFVGAWRDGIDDCFNIPDTEEEAKATIPADLIEDWGIINDFYAEEDAA
jgi:hypothetical protein